MRYFYLSASLICALFAAFVAWENVSVFALIFFALVSGWYACLGLGKETLPDDVVLKFGGVCWTEEDFCRGWEIDGRTGSGKTASGVVPIIYQLKKNRPEVGILALDTKGDLSEPLARIASDLNCREQPRAVGSQGRTVPLPIWKPVVTMNFLADTSIPYSTYAKIIVDVATAAGQKGGQAFFKVAAQTAIQNTFSRAGGGIVQSRSRFVPEIIASDDKYKEMATAPFRIFPAPDQN